MEDIEELRRWRTAVVAAGKSHGLRLDAVAMEPAAAVSLLIRTVALFATDPALSPRAAVRAGGGPAFDLSAALHHPSTVEQSATLAKDYPVIGFVHQAPTSGIVAVVAHGGVRWLDRPMYHALMRGGSWPGIPGIDLPPTGGEG